MTLQTELRHLIDQAAGNAGIEAVQQFIDNNPELDLNAITANGLSALWWALTPPRNQRINIELLRYLLPRVNIVQTYLDYTPRQYLLMLRENATLDADNAAVNSFLDELTRLEHQYVAPATPEPANLAALAAIANDSQNVHTRQMTTATDAIVVRLYTRYKSSLTNCHQVLQDIRQARSPLSHFTSHFTWNSFLDSFDPLNALERNTTARTYPLEGSSIELTLAQILCLVWQAANETDTTLLCGSTDSSADRDERRQAVLKALQEGYGYCWTGQTTRIVHALNAMHRDVQYKQAELDNEQSRYKYYAMINQELSILQKEEPAQFRHLVAIALLGDENASDAAKQSQRVFIDKLKQGNFVESLRAEKLNPETIKAICKELDAKMLPTVCFPAVKLLSNLQMLFARYNETALFNEMIQADEVAFAILPSCLINRFPVEKLRGEASAWLSVHFQQDFLKRSAEEQSKLLRFVISTYAYAASESLPDSFQEAMTQLMTKALLSEYMAASLPNYNTWLDTLPATLLEPLAQLVNESRESDDLSEAKIYHFALQNGYIKHLQVNLQDADLRGVNLSDIDCSEVILSQADCRLITYNHASQLNHVDLKEVLLSPHCLINLLSRFQDTIARGGKADAQDLALAEALLSSQSFNVNDKNEKGASCLDIILGRNRYQHNGENTWISMPPVQALFNHPKVKAHSSEIKCAVKVIDLKRTLTGLNVAMFASLIVVAGATLAVGVTLALAIEIPLVAVAVVTVVTAIVAMAEGVAIFLGFTTLGRSCRKYCDVRGSGYRYASNHGHPFTSRHWLRLKRACRAATYPFRRIKQIVGHLFRSETHSTSAQAAVSHGSASMQYPPRIESSNQPAASLAVKPTQAPAGSLALFSTPTPRNSNPQKTLLPPNHVESLESDDSDNESSPLLGV